MQGVFEAQTRINIGFDFQSHQKGTPVCSETWSGNTADVKTLIQVASRLQNRFNIPHFCLVADQGMISQETMVALDEKEIPFFRCQQLKYLPVIFGSAMP